MNSRRLTSFINAARAPRREVRTSTRIDGCDAGQFCGAQVAVAGTSQSGRRGSRCSGLFVLSMLLVACESAVSGADATLAPRDAATDVAGEADARSSINATLDGPVADTSSRLPRCVGAPVDPVSRGACELRSVLVDRGIDVRIEVLVAAHPRAASLLAASPDALAAPEGSFAVLRDGDGLVVLGRDAAGAMYGALELSERIRLDGAAALATAHTLRGTPTVPFRAANLFLTLPDRGESRWWFREDAFWDEYLDLLMHARINVLDLHGMYDMQTTIFPNALLYFATSVTYPQVGVPAAERARNLGVLRRVVEQAASRGIRVGLMTYRSDTDPRGLDHPVLTRDEDVARYTREAAEALARAVPGLWALGFRIGESERPARWYADTFLRGVRNAGTGTRVYLRTWLAARDDVLALREAAGEGFIAEAKYNGEQLGAPYPIAGGRWSRYWAQYTYESYLDETPDYGFVFQVRTGGTHRIFRHVPYALTRRAVVTTTMGGASGFSFEPAHAFYPQRTFYNAHAGDEFFPWTFRRDELTYHLWGRLGYDPTTPEGTFRAIFARRLGTDALWEPMQAASTVVPWIEMGMSCGPDHRDHAPELEWNGDIVTLASPPEQPGPIARACAARHVPLDNFAVAGPWETARDLLAAVPTTRLTPREVAATLLDAAARARRAGWVRLEPSQREARSVQRECLALADLAEYHAHKLRAATALAVYQGSLSEPWLAYAQQEVSAARRAWSALVAHTAHIAEFDEHLRMIYLGLPRFHWRREQPWVDGDLAALENAAEAVRRHPPNFHGTLPDPSHWEREERSAFPSIVTPSEAWYQPLPDDRRIRIVFAEALPAGTFVQVLWKPIDAREDWRRLDTTAEGAAHEAVLPGDAARVLVAVEVNGPVGVARRLPDPRERTPYWLFTRR
jgi:hypothetical protein